jgi:hypothetical protein
MLFTLALLLMAAATADARLKFEYDSGSSSSSSSSSRSRGRGRHSDSSSSAGTSSSSSSSGLAESTYDYVFVGGGMASIAGAYWLSDALHRCNRPVSIAVIEKQNYLGGNVYDVPLKMPPASRYDGSWGPQLRGGLGALRTTQLALGLKRRLQAQLNLTMYWTPFRNDVNMRGVRRVCRDPIEKAFASDPTNAYKYGDFCNNDPPFVNAANDAAAVYKGFDQFDPFVLSENGASGAVYLYLLQNVPHITGEPDIDANDNWALGYGGLNPITGEQCEPDGPGSLPHCPFARSAKRDWKTHMELEVRAGAMQALNQNVSAFMRADAVGFFGDYENGYSARSLAEYNVFEWNTNSYNAYMPNGESTLVNAMVAKAKTRGVQFFVDEQVLNIEKSSAASGALYDLKTNRRRVRVRKYLGLNLPRFYLFPARHDDAGVRFDGADLSGSIVERLRSVREVQAPVNARSLKIIVQYEPGVRQWFWDKFDGVNGNYSYRQYGDTGCTARIELIDTPFHRCANYITVVYSDALCLRKWQTYIDIAEQTADYSILRLRMHEELMAAFPEDAHKMTSQPVLVRYRLFDSAWHYTRTGYDDVGLDRIAEIAPEPLGPSERLSLIGEGYFMRRSGWIEGALRSAKRMLQRVAALESFEPSLEAVFDDLFDILRDNTGGICDSSPLDSAGNVSSFGYMPPAYAVAERDLGLMVSNEHWGPFGPYNVDGYDQDSCRPSHYGIRV